MKYILTGRRGTLVRELLTTGAFGCNTTTGAFGCNTPNASSETSELIEGFLAEGKRAEQVKLF